jgi:hypothetical protein
MKPKPILFDTSTWDFLVRDSTSEELADLLKDRFVPLLTFEIFQEMMNVSQELREKRSSFLLSLPKLASIRFGDAMLGSIIDLRSLEYYFLLNGTRASEIKLRILDRIKTFSGKSLAFLAGVDLEACLEKHAEANLIISQPIWKVFQDQSIRKKKLRDIPLSHSVSKEKAEPHLKHLIHAINKNSDRRKPEVLRNDAAEHFGNLFRQRLEIEGYRNPLGNMLEEMGIGLGDLDADQTLEDLHYRYEYIKKLKLFAELLNRPLAEITSVKETEVISWQIEKTVRKIYEENLLSDTKRSPEVSSIIDRRQAGFSHYMKVFVDKRTRELLDKSANQLNYRIEYSCVRDMADLKAILTISPG